MSIMDTTEWIKELCPEIADWQAELIAEHVEERVAAEREACAVICDAEADEFGGMSDGFYAAKNCAAAIRARGGE